MINEVGGVPKIAQAQAAARGAVEFLLKHRDQVGIVAFEIKPKTLVPLTRVEPGNVGEIEHKINTIPANGGTNIYKGLAAGVEEIEKSKAKDRHIILLTDGISEPGTYRQLVPGLKKGKISVATVALGAEADFRLLKEIAADTGGNYYATENARDLPKIFDKETRINTRTVRLRGQIGVSSGDPSPITGSLVGRSAAAAGRQRRDRTEAGRRGGAARPGQKPPARPGARPVAVRLRPGRRLDARADAGMGGRMAGTAAALPGRGALGRARGRAAAADPEPRPRQPARARSRAGRRRRQADRTRIAGRDAAPRRRARRSTLRFEEAAAEPLDRAAARTGRRANTNTRSARVGAGSLTGKLAIPYAAEFRLGRIDTTPLGPLAAATGGTTLAVADPGHIEGDSHHLWWLFAALGLACLPGRRRPAAARRRLGRGGPRGAETGRSAGP